MPLSDTAIRNSKHKEKPYKLSDERGLFLLIHPNGSKYWRQNYRFGGKAKTLAHGVYPDVGLGDARERRDAARKLLADGVDPGEQIKIERAKDRDDHARQIAATRFLLDSDGGLFLNLGKRSLSLTPSETGELWAFLDATRAVLQKR
jgi:hypothetical protein